MRERARGGGWARGGARARARAADAHAAVVEDEARERHREVLLRRLGIRVEGHLVRLLCGAGRGGRRGRLAVSVGGRNAAQRQCPDARFARHARAVEWQARRGVEWGASERGGRTNQFKPKQIEG